VSIRLNFVDELELAELHDATRELFRSFGLEAAALDRAVDGALHAALVEIETTRRCKQEIRERLSVVK
jgi:hypothetical protein